MSDRLDLRYLSPSGAADGDVPVYNSTSLAWEPGAGGALTVQDENANVATGVTQLDFQGLGVTVTAGTGEAIVTIEAGSGTVVGASVVREIDTGFQSISNNAADDPLIYTAATFDTTGTMWDSGSPTILTVPTDGLYRITATCTFQANNDTGYREIRLRKNANSFDLGIGGDRRGSLGATANVPLRICLDRELLAGDEIDVVAYQNSGTALQVHYPQLIIDMVNPGDPIAATGVTIQNENAEVAAGVQQIDFQGGGVTAATGTGEVVVTVPLQALLLESGGTVPVGTPVGCIIFEKA